MFFVSCVSHAFTSVYCCLVVTCWERTDLLALVGGDYCIFVTFPCGILGQVWYLIVSFADLCHLSYFVIECFGHGCLVSIICKGESFPDYSSIQDFEAGFLKILN